MHSRRTKSQELALSLEVRAPSSASLPPMEWRGGRETGLSIDLLLLTHLRRGISILSSAAGVVMPLL